MFNKFFLICIIGLLVANASYPFSLFDEEDGQVTGDFTHQSFHELTLQFCNGNAESYKKYISGPQEGCIEHYSIIDGEKSMTGQYPRGHEWYNSVEKIYDRLFTRCNSGA